ncbi:hypothetical protein BHM03_00061512 [Ensete ventricosum]|nr:hypothetical protein BHM03_00061512 [Ensete ventricosum]
MGMIDCSSITAAAAGSSHASRSWVSSKPTTLAPLHTMTACRQQSCIMAVHEEQAACGHRPHLGGVRVGNSCA